nr:MAG TPA: hypothetical protein [Picobirnaviridae sp.]
MKLVFTLYKTSKTHDSANVHHTLVCTHESNFEKGGNSIDEESN